MSERGAFKLIRERDEAVKRAEAAESALTAEIQARQEAETTLKDTLQMLDDVRQARAGYKVNNERYHELNRQLRAQVTSEREARQQAERERDLARAHDSQPYPTADAYEAVCATLNRTKDALTASERARATLQTALAGLVACCTTADGAIGPEPADRGLWLACMLEARAALSSSSAPRVTKTDDQGSR